MTAHRPFSAALTRTSLLLPQSCLGRITVAAGRCNPLLATALQQPQQHQQHQPYNHQQIRTVRNRGWAFTKRRLKRMARAKKRAELREKLGVKDPRPKPPKYIPRDLPVVNAQTDEEIKAEIRANDIKVTEELNAKLKAAQETKLLRFHMSGLQMSDRVRKLFDLQNGNQKEVIKAQKQLGMEVFQLRPGDTGSSAVQGTFSKYIIRYVLFAVFFVSCFSCWNHHATFAVIALTTHIQQMQAHMGRHRKDNHNKRNLQRMLTRRRKVLDYMERKEFEAYRRVVKTLGLVRTK